MNITAYLLSYFLAEHLILLPSASPLHLSSELPRKPQWRCSYYRGFPTEAVKTKLHSEAKPFTIVHSMGRVRSVRFICLVVCTVRFLASGITNRREILHDDQSTSPTHLLRILKQCPVGSPNVGLRKGLKWEIFGLSDTDSHSYTFDCDYLNNLHQSISCQLGPKINRQHERSFQKV